MIPREHNMQIGDKLNGAFNAQIGRELASSNQYVNVAAYFDDRALRLLAGLFYKQAEEEREHAMKFVKYLTDVSGRVAVPAIAEPKHAFASAEEAVRLAYEWELDIT